MKKFLQACSGHVLILAAFLLSLPSCVNEDYDVGNLDTEITIGGESLAIPVGSTEKLTLKNLLSGMDQDMLQVLDDGSYALRMNDSMDFGDIIPDFSDMLVLQDIEASSSVAVPMLSKGKFHLGQFQVDFDDELEFTLIDSDFPADEVHSIGQILFDDGFMDFYVRFDDLPEFEEGKDINVSMSLILPDEMILDQDDPRIDGQVLTVDGTLDEGKFEMAPLKIVGFDLSDYDILSGEDLVGKISLEGTLSVDDTDVDFDSIHDGTMFNMSLSFTDVEVKEIHSHLFFEIDSDEQHVSLAGFPDFVKDDDFMLDIVNPHLILNLNTNMRVPASEVLRIIPVIDGKRVTDNAVDVNISLPVAESSDKPVHAVLWLGDDESRCPDGYTFVKTEIRKLIGHLPDEFLFSIHTETDVLKDCVIGPGAKTFMDLEYDIVVPMEFGEDLHIEMSHQMSGLPGIMSEMLSNNIVCLTGEITSSLPVQLDFTVDLLDRDGRVIALTKNASQKIAACKTGGSPNVSPLDLTLDVADNGKAVAIDALKLTFLLSSPTASGVPFKESDFIQAKLGLKLPEGITIDLENL